MNRRRGIRTWNETRIGEAMAESGHWHYLLPGERSCICGSIPVRLAALPPTWAFGVLAIVITIIVAVAAGLP